MIIPNDLIDHSADMDGFISDTAATIFQVGALLAGRTLGLFNANHRMYGVRDLLEVPMQRHRLRLLCQGFGSRAWLARMFRRDRRAVLLGSRSFWEGVDVPGRALSAVVMEKIPFDSPRRPIIEARIEEVKARSTNAFGYFMFYYLPLALLQLRQGAGRLIRVQEDYGAIFLLQSNLWQKKYRTQVLGSLPPGQVIGGSARDCLDQMANWFRKIEPNSVRLYADMRQECEADIVTIRGQVAPV